MGVWSESMLRALVVDDEKPARDDLVWMLQREVGISEVSEADGGTEALKLLGQTEVGGRFDVVFLDMKMPDLSGLDIARMINRFEDPPAIVFVTAFDTPASDAYELGVVDYLRKPVAAERLTRAVQRVANLRNSQSETTEAEETAARLTVSGAAGRQVVLGPADVTHFQSSGDYVRVHTDGESFLVRDTMARLTGSWSDYGFVRVHRSYSVRVSAVREIRSSGSGKSLLVNDREIPVSRRYSRDLNHHLQDGQPK